jgi:hypothetical protein
MLSEDGSGKGAALIAAVAFHQQMMKKSAHGLQPVGGGKK